MALTQQEFDQLVSDCESIQTVRENLSAEQSGDLQEAVPGVEVSGFGEDTVIALKPPPPPPK